MAWNRSTASARASVRRVMMAGRSLSPCSIPVGWRSIAWVRTIQAPRSLERRVWRSIGRRFCPDWFPRPGTIVMWVWASMRPGMRNSSGRSRRSAPAGISISEEGPAATIRSPSNSNVPSRIADDPVPSQSHPARIAVAVIGFGLLLISPLHEASAVRFPVTKGGLWRVHEPPTTATPVKRLAHSSTVCLLPRRLLGLGRMIFPYLRTIADML